MCRKIISTFTAAAISMSITFAVPVAVTAVSSLAVVPEAQALGFKSIKKAAKKTVKKTVKGAKKVGRGFKETGSALKEPFANRENRAVWNHVLPELAKGAGRGVKKTVFSAKGAGKLVWSDMKRADRHVSEAAGSYARCLKKGCGRIGDLPNIHDHRN